MSKRVWAKPFVVLKYGTRVPLCLSARPIKIRVRREMSENCGKNWRAAYGLTNVLHRRQTRQQSNVSGKTMKENSEKQSLDRGESRPGSHG